jgi:hypothetical protein
MHTKRAGRGPRRRHWPVSVTLDEPAWRALANVREYLERLYPFARVSVSSAVRSALLEAEARLKRER